MHSNPFSSFGNDIRALENKLHSKVDCCHKCIELIKNSDGDWKKLPEGRLRKAFEEANERTRKC